MKKIILLLSLVFIPVSVMADMAGVKVPTSQNGLEASINYAGVQYKYVTTEVETVVSSNPCVLFGIFVDSATTAGTYAIFRDTDAANGSGAQALTQFYIDASTTSRSITLPQPVRFTNLTVAVTRAAGYPKSVTVLYLDR